MKIYISGKISGLTPEEYGHNFAHFEKIIKAHGHEVVNPIKILPFDEKYKWADYMRADIKHLIYCDAIFAMPNWIGSRGARIEVRLAYDLEMTVFFNTNHIPLGNN